MSSRTASPGAAIDGAAVGDAGGSEIVRVTVLGTTDTHGNVLNWDYFKDAEYADPARNGIGLAKLSSLINEVRADRGQSATLTIDAGDTIQGTPLSYYFAKIDPITGGSVHPMAAVMNAIGYDAAALGNHEFNYGLDVLRTFESQLNYPLLGANALDWHTDEPAFGEYIIKRVEVSPGLAVPSDQQPSDQQPTDRQPTYVNVGIVGLVTPGCAIWDKGLLEGRLKFTGVVEQAAQLIPKVKQAGADIIIVACHSGADTSSSYGDALPWPENAATLLAENVPDIDAILVGHAHAEIPQRFVTGPDGRTQVLLSEPFKWGMRLTVMDLDLQRGEDGRWQVLRSGATLLNANAAKEDPAISQLIAAQHEQTRTYVNGVIGTSTTAMSAATARYQATEAIDFINYVQAAAVTAALADSEWAELPVLAIAAPFNADSAIPAGEVTIRHVAGLYAYDNTLLAIVLTGAQIREYLEFSASYFKQVSGTGPFAPGDLTNAPTTAAPTGVPDYNFDIIGGLGTSVSTSLSYDIDIARPPGSRISNLSYAGEPIGDDRRFVVAINNYRAAGGGNFPGVTTAPVVYDAQLEIRQLILDWVSETGTIDPAVFSASSVPTWRLVSGGQPVKIVPVPQEAL
ncbi:bifunctional metallophosphatase/5'-nucleotidase [Jatrophihabitans sp. DSM 45814]